MDSLAQMGCLALASFAHTPPLRPTGDTIAMRKGVAWLWRDAYGSFQVLMVRSLLVVKPREPSEEKATDQSQLAWASICVIS